MRMKSDALSDPLVKERFDDLEETIQSINFAILIWLTIAQRIAITVITKGIIFHMPNVVKK